MYRGITSITQACIQAQYQQIEAAVQNSQFQMIHSSFYSEI